MTREEMALEALMACKCWLCPTVQDGHLQYIAGYATSPYGGVQTIQSSLHDDPWECLRLGLEWMKSQEAEWYGTDEKQPDPV